MFGQQAAFRQAQEFYARQEAMKKKRTKEGGSSSTAAGLSNTSAKKNKSPKETVSVENFSLSEHSHTAPVETRKKRGLFHRHKKAAGPALDEAGKIPASITTTMSTSEAKSTTTNINNNNGKKSSTTKEKQQKAQETLEMIQKTIASQEEREAEIDQKISESLREAKAKLLVAGNQRAAIRYMKKVKLYQMEQTKIAAAIETMEAQILTIESAMNNFKVMEAMQAGSTAMKNLQSSGENDGNFTSNAVSFADDLICEIRDTMDYAAEVNEILSKPVEHVILDDDELLRELQAIGGDGGATNEEASTANSDMEIDLPIAPTTNICSSKPSEPEDDEFVDSAQIMLAD